MKPSESTFAALMGIEGNQWHYHIPRFQREYVWGKYNWGKLLEDIYENEPGHYMGSVICVQETTELVPGQELIYEVVDGQQRLTTLSLLIAAIYSKLTREVVQNDPSIKEEDDYIIMRNSIRQRLIKKLDSSLKPLPNGSFSNDKLVYCLRVQPSTQENNLDDYKYILAEIGILKDIECPKNCGNRRLYKAYKYFLKSLPDDYERLNVLLERIYRLSFIHISESSQSKAFLLFETLNFRGVPLSAIDIIKNKMLSVLERKHSRPIMDAYEEWQTLLENLPEDRDQDRFLRQFYNAFKYKAEIKIDRIPKATASTIIAIYESLITRNAETIFEDLLQKAKIYNNLIEPEKYPVSVLNTSLVNLERIGAATSYTFLLYLFSKPDVHFSENTVKEKVVELLCKYYFRRNITDFPNTRDLDAINIEMIESCEMELLKGNKISYELIEKVVLTGRGKPSSIVTFRNQLEDNIFYNNEGMARYALARLNESYHSREYNPGLWDRNEKGLYIWTVEHIFPQGKNIPEYWVEMIGNGDRAVTQKVYDEMVHCFGNLTLSGYNSKLSNQSFDKKQSKHEINILGNKIFIGYKNGLALNDIPFLFDDAHLTLANADKWTSDYISARNKAMVNSLLSLFKFDYETLDVE